MFSGYHYAFANFNADPKFMAEHFNATLTYSHDSNLLMVARGRADIALVTRSYLSDFLARNVDMAAHEVSATDVEAAASGMDTKIVQFPRRLRA